MAKSIDGVSEAIKMIVEYRVLAASLELRFKILLQMIKLNRRLDALFIEAAGIGSLESESARAPIAPEFSADSFLPCQYRQLAEKDNTTADAIATMEKC